MPKVKQHLGHRNHVRLSKEWRDLPTTTAIQPMKSLLTNTRLVYCFFDAIIISTVYKMDWSSKCVLSMDNDPGNRARTMFQSRSCDHQD